MEEEFLEELFGIGRFVIGGACQLVGGFIDVSAEHVADLTGTVMDTFDVPGSDFVRDHGKMPFELLGRGLEELGKHIVEE